MKLDFDSNGLLDITSNNIELITFCLSIDSSYRNAFNTAYKNGSAWYIKNKLNFNNQNSILQACKLIDKENSTHLSVSGKIKGSNKGIEIIANFIYLLRATIEKDLKNGKTDLVNDISKAVEGRHNFSFASKFCTYVSRYKYNVDKYVIYDDVLKDVLPYYAFMYLGKADYKAIKNSNINKKFVDNNDYKGYKDFIENIIQAIKVKNGISISKEQFDKIIWYYYKGDKELRQNTLNCIK